MIYAEYMHTKMYHITYVPDGSGNLNMAESSSAISHTQEHQILKWMRFGCDCDKPQGQWS